ncbi:aspartate/glutamate racemase family protein [Pseudomonas yamanorum]|uniref:aspartate/glutamate racemase family protein n=1 Tax=Pseudomonas yamanorum TaxID=515393 RepID=UPI001C47E36E|nr:aspartate/glutamate racemase family protein [Pseudomonas yamanorum]MBV6664201.1 aspartate/glutamate racemase family protein [Pseudomonas yamanorum]
MRITCLHTAESNIAVFDTAAAALGIRPQVLHHAVRADLLAAVERAGKLTADVAEQTRRELVALARHGNAVVLTCSTLGPVVELAGAHTQVPILRADEALAFAAVHAGGKVTVLCAIETTIEPTSRLFLQVAKQAGASVEVQWVPGAWAMFKAGDLQGYLATIGKAADRAYMDGASIVALGQASMSGAASLVTAGPAPLTSASAGLKAALSRAERGYDPG